MGIIINLIGKIKSRIKYEFESPFFDCDLDEIDFEL